jgi:hypothetical protein
MPNTFPGDTHNRNLSLSCNFYLYPTAARDGSQPPTPTQYGKRNKKWGEEKKEKASVWYHTINRGIYNYFKSNTHTHTPHAELHRDPHKRAEMARRESLNNI